MARPSRAALNPRKQPRQARSQATVEAVFEACIQVLLTDGPMRLTTTRVAERAGVSVGSLYQYYPNKQALLFAVLARHLNKVADAVEAAAQLAKGRSLPDMVATVVEAFVGIKLAKVDESRALYGVAGDLKSTDIVNAVGGRCVKAIAAMLSTAPRARFADVRLSAYIWFTAMVGCTRAMLEGGAPPKTLRTLRDQLVALGLSYLRCEGIPKR
jgi:AcrR family transcriptional regulator